MDEFKTEQTDNLVSLELLCRGIDMKTVPANYCEGYNMSLMQLFGKGPKFTVSCGECNLNFRGRIEMVDNPALRCPFCGTVNVLNLVLNRGET